MTDRPKLIEPQAASRCYVADKLALGGSDSRVPHPLRYRGRLYCAVSGRWYRGDQTWDLMECRSIDDFSGPSFQSIEDKGLCPDVVRRILADPALECDPEDLTSLRHVLSSEGAPEDEWLWGRSSAVARCDPLGFYHGIEFAAGQLGRLVLVGPEFTVSEEPAKRQESLWT